MSKLDTDIQPRILKLSQDQRSGINAHKYLRHGIGMVLRGTKYFYNGDSRIEVKKGDLFFINSGYHYTEEVPDDEDHYEQLVVHYSQQEISSTLTRLNMIYGLGVENDHICDNCRETKKLIVPASNLIRDFFFTLNRYHKEPTFNQDKTGEELKMTELIYLMISSEEQCFKHKLLENTDSFSENFKKIIHQNIFNNISIEELSGKCNCSLTLFKKEFRKHFADSPHKWFVRQRLTHARLLLISTNKSVSEIGNESGFTNTSHFIKLFKREYKMTPSVYRNVNVERKGDSGVKRERVTAVNAAVMASVGTMHGVGIVV